MDLAYLTGHALTSLTDYQIAGAVLLVPRGHLFDQLAQAVIYAVHREHGAQPLVCLVLLHNQIAALDIVPPHHQYVRRTLSPQLPVYP
ncbi:hypothetical protein D3C77_169520 [compost metagenome]